MKLNKFVSYIIYFYFIWIPFEWFIIKWFFANPIALRGVRITLDLIPLLLLIFLILVGQLKLYWNNIKLIILFPVAIFTVVMANLIHGGDQATSINFLGVLLRFIPFAIIIPSLNPQDWKLETIASKTNTFLYIFLTLGVLEFFLRQTLRNFLLPSPEIFMALFYDLPTAYREEEFYPVSATFINTIEFSFYIIGLFIIFIYTEKRMAFKLCIFAITCFVVFASRSSASLLCIFLITFYAFFDKKINRYIGYTLGSIASFTFILFNINYLEWYFFISHKFGRLGILHFTLPSFISSGFKNTLFGIGSDSKVVYETISKYDQVPLMLLYDAGYSSFKDVYWVALLVHLGIITFSLLLYILIDLFRLAKQTNTPLKFILVTFLWIVIFLGFINQVLDVKSFSFLFWIVVGVTYSDINHLSIPQNKNDRE